MDTNGKQFWEMTLNKLKQQLSNSSYDTWFTSTIGLEFDGKVLKVGVENDFQRDWLETKYTSNLQEIISHMNGKQVSLQFIVKEKREVIN